MRYQANHRSDPSRGCVSPAKTAALCAATLLCAASADAAFIQVSGTGGWVAEDPAHNGGGAIGGQIAVGTAGSTNDSSAGMAGLLFVQLPDLTAAPQVQSAQLSLLMGNPRQGGVVGVVPEFNVDLYYLGLRSTLSINKPGDYGELGINPAGSTLVQDNWWLAHDTTQIGVTQSIDITSSLQNAYTSGVPNDSFAVFGLYGDASFATNTFTTYWFGNPQFEITHIPTPGSVALLGASGLLAVRRRRA